MSQNPIGDEQQKELSWEEAVSRYLEDHPEYFERHPETLARLTLTHDVSGRAVSLIERQVQALREREQTLSRQLRELVSIARENDVLGNRLHRFALAMLEARALDEVLDTAAELLRQEFKLDAVVIRLQGRPAPAAGRAEFTGTDDRKLAALLQQFSAGKPICGGKYEDGLMQYLFGERSAEIRSSALIPVGDKSSHGVLALGCQDPHRFHPGMGTVYLTRLGELLRCGLARHIG
jgi:uncharacterized protein YigA (DUF484 family)